MAGGMITQGAVCFGICYNHKIPIAWSGVAIPKQYTVTARGMACCSDIDIVVTSCGHTGVMIATTGVVYIHGIRACAGYSPIVGGGVLGSALPIIQNVTAM